MFIFLLYFWVKILPLITGNFTVLFILLPRAEKFSSVVTIPFNPASVWAVDAEIKSVSDSSSTVKMSVLLVAIKKPMFSDLECAEIIIDVDPDLIKNTLVFPRAEGERRTANSWVNNDYTDTRRGRTLASTKLF